MQTVPFEKRLMHSLKGLPKEALLEVLDFIEFLRNKNFKKPADNITHKLSELDAQQLKHLEEEFADYKKLYPRE